MGQLVRNRGIRESVAGPEADHARRNSLLATDPGCSMHVVGRGPDIVMVGLPSGSSKG